MADHEAHRDDAGDGRGHAAADVAFSLLDHRVRRYVLYYLTRRAATAELCELVDQIAAWEGGTGDRDRLTTSLYHVHLPTLAERGVITFDETTRRVALEGGATALSPYLDLAAREDLPSPSVDARSSLRGQRGGATLATGRHARRSRGPAVTRRRGRRGE